MTVIEQEKPAAALKPAVLIPQVLEEVLTLFDRQGISYCYWKSSLRIQSALRGDSDVDLLVALKDMHRMELILLKQDFKRVTTLASSDHGAITSFLGFDERTGRLIHLHVHFRLMLGEPLLKNYHAPWEQELLARAIFHPSFPIRVLDPVSEAFLLTVRMSLEVSRFDPVAVRQQQATLRKFALDREALSKRVSREDLRELSARLLGEDAAGLPGDILFDSGPASNAKRQLKKNLSPFRTYNSLEMRVRSLSRALSWAFGHLNKRVLHLPRPWSRRAPGGGRVISIIGVDGSGKSTAVSTIKNWLGGEMDVMPIYLGTGNGRASLLLLPLKLMVPLATKLVGPRPKEASDGKVSGRRRGPLYTALLTVWATVVAIEKRGKLISAHRGADRGLLVLTDRYPQNEILDFNEAPMLARLNNVPGWLRRFEANAYAPARRLPPDLVVKLIVSQATAERREPELSPAVIERRLESVKKLKFAGATVVSIDAEQPLERVSLAIKREVWRIL
jgi:hypothetical protein